MKQRQFNKAVTAILDDCDIRNMYETLAGTCAIGGLAKAAGIDYPHVGQPFNSGTGIHSFFIRQLADGLERAYGLTRSELSVIQGYNDSWKTKEKRQIVIIEYLKQITKFTLTKKSAARMK